MDVRAKEKKETGEKKKEKGANTVTNLLKKYAASNDIISPIRIVKKDFYPNISSQTIFEGCDTILKKINLNPNSDIKIFSYIIFRIMKISTQKDNKINTNVIQVFMKDVFII
jgi:hypothetical protein